MTEARRFLIATGTARYTNMPSEDRLELVEEVARIERLFERLGYTIAEGFSMDMTGPELKQAVHAFADSDRTEDDVVVFYYTGHGVVEGDHFLFVPTNADPNRLGREGIRAVDLARWLFDCPKVGHLMIIVDSCYAGHGAIQVAVAALGAMGRDVTNRATGPASVVLMTATGAKQPAESGAFTQAFEKAVTELEEERVDQPYLDIAELVARINTLIPEWQRATHHVLGSDRPEPFLPVSHTARRAVRDTLDHHENRLDRVEKRLDRREHHELLALREEMRSDDSAGPLHPDEHATLVQALTSLPPSDAKNLAALYRQSVERATGQPPPEPLGEIHDYTDLFRELGQYLPGDSATTHPLIAFCALLVEWFPNEPGLAPVRPLLDQHVEAAQHRQNVATDVSAIVLLEPAHPSGHFLLTVWCYYGPDDVELAYHGPQAVPLDQLREDLRRALADALDSMARRLYKTPSVQTPGVVEFIVPLELLGEPVEDWLIGADEPGEERIGWHYPVVLRDLSRCRLPRLHAGWQRKWHHLNRVCDQHGMSFTWFDCDANPATDPVAQFFATDGDLVAFTGPPLTGHRHKLLATGLKAGVPAMLWRAENCVRDDSGCDCGKFTQLIEASVAGRPLTYLPARVHALRMRESGPGPGGFHRLTLVWDDPFRWPEPPTQFADPTRRGVPT